MRRTYHVTTQGILDFCEPAAERMQLSTRLAALLELALQSAEDVVKSETTLARHADVCAHPAHAHETLRLEGWPPLLRARTVGAALAVAKVEGAVTAAGLVRHRTDEARALLRLGALCGLLVEFSEDA